MLVLTRKIEQAIILDSPGADPLRIKVLSIRGRSVRLGIEAPLSVRVIREEAKQKERKGEQE